MESWRVWLLIVVFISFPSLQFGYARGQQRMITVQFSDIPLSEALSKVEEASGYSFFYDANMLDLSKHVSLDVKNQKLHDVLDVMFRSTGVALRFQIIRLHYLQRQRVRKQHLWLNNKKVLR